MLVKKKKKEPVSTVAHVAGGSAAFMMGVLSSKDILIGGRVLDIISDAHKYKIKEATAVLPGVCGCISMKPGVGNQLHLEKPLQYG